MTLIVEPGEPVIVVCDWNSDQRGEFHTGEFNVARAVEMAEALGWDVDSNERAFCPRHKETL